MIALSILATETADKNIHFLGRVENVAIILRIHCSWSTVFLNAQAKPSSDCGAADQPLVNNYVN
jgi:hypothetical protein